MEDIKISFITTVYNEEDSIKEFLDSLFNQSKLPDEIIVVDGGSTDRTVMRITNYELRITNYGEKFRIIQKKGNRAVGRNEAIKIAKGNIIVCSDAGCIVDKNWIQEIIKPFINGKIDAVAGYYKAQTKNVFQKCLAPYVLVMEDKLNAENFLPSSRSMAFTKDIWKKADKFPEKFSHNEDYVFAKKLKKIGAHITFQKTAIVYWIPRNNTTEAFKMFFCFALGDAEARIIRPKVVFLVIRYTVGLFVLFLWFNTKLMELLFLLILGVFVYIAWAILKNYRYVKDIRAVFILPALQVISDIAVLLGTLIGFSKLIK